MSTLEAEDMKQSYGEKITEEFKHVLRQASKSLVDIGEKDDMDRIVEISLLYDFVRSAGKEKVTLKEVMRVSKRLEELDLHSIAQLLDKVLSNSGAPIDLSSALNEGHVFV